MAWTSWYLWGGGHPSATPGGRCCGGSPFSKPTTSCSRDRARGHCDASSREGTFHQIHGGVATNAPTFRQQRRILREFHSEYLSLRGQPFEPPAARPWYFGGSHPRTLDSIELSARLARRRRHPWRRFTAMVDWRARSTWAPWPRRRRTENRTPLGKSRRMSRRF